MSEKSSEKSSEKFPAVGHRYLVDFKAFRVELDFASETSMTYYNLDQNGQRVGSETSAYRRGTWFDLRREILDIWSGFLTK